MQQMHLGLFDELIYGLAFSWLAESSPFGRSPRRRNAPLIGLSCLKRFRLFRQTGTVPPPPTEDFEGKWLHLADL
jgi:hypothetical protein